MQQNYAKVGGILSIVAGGLGCLSALVVIFIAVAVGFFSNSEVYYNDRYASPDNFFIIMMVIYAVLGVIGILVSVLAIVGGVYGIKKKNWGLALAGSIAGVLAFFPCGVVAVIFTAMGKPEFETLPAPRAA